MRNSLWPSRPALPVAAQKAEMIALLDRAAALRLNAVIFQVRPTCDALFVSELEPWSEFLTGAQGVAPEPLYDPLAFAVAEAHKRGLELHAWFNPYRARLNAELPAAANHISRTRPDLVRAYGRYLWLDPGEPEVQDHSLRVVLDVVRRYDIDGVHFDDYFYPYPARGPDGRNLPFPDDASWQRHGVASGLSRGDWRRRNVNQFIERVSRAIRAEKPWVKFGISPFGIWRPGHPPAIRGLDAYATIYADARKWLAEGWVDYMAPQLYWAIDPPAQSFPALLRWWADNNPKRRHLWPGVNSLRVGDGATGWPASEIVRQIELAREITPGAPGVIHWSHSALMRNPDLQAALRREVYRQVALPPAYPWLPSRTPGKPAARMTVKGQEGLAKWTASRAGETFRWVVQVRQSGEWKTQIFPRQTTSLRFLSLPEALAITGVDRNGNAGPPVVLQRRE